MAKPEKFVHLHLVYHFRVPLKNKKKLKTSISYFYKKIENLKNEKQVQSNLIKLKKEEIYKKN